MNYDFKNNAIFKSFLKDKEADIIKKTAGGIQESEVFKIFHASLVSYLNDSSFLGFKVLLIAKNELEQLPDNYYGQLLDTLNSKECSDNNLVILDSNFNIVNKERNHNRFQNSNDARKFYRELSDKFIVFILQPNGLVNYFIDGEDFGDGIFYTIEDFKTYEERKTVDKIDELFAEYRIRLQDRNTYNKFFVAKSHLKSLRSDLNSQLSEKEFINEFKDLLHNTPENRFRDDLRDFLTKRLKAVITMKEYMLDDLKRLDIFIVDESGNEFYLIEVKWVGRSIHSTGKKLGTCYNDKHIIPDAIQQSLHYIKELHEETINIKRGYLAVFDARKEEVPSIDQNIEDICSKEDRKFIAKFCKLPYFRVVNMHPA